MITEPKPEGEIPGNDTAPESEPSPTEEAPEETPEETAAAEGEFQDREMVCRECGAGFTFTAGEQDFYRSRGFTHEPTRCPECRNSRRGGRRAIRTEEDASRVVCAACGVITSVPFHPTGNKPVYCRDCYTVRA